MLCGCLYPLLQQKQALQSGHMLMHQYDQNFSLVISSASTGYSISSLTLSGGLCLTTLVDTLIATALGFIALRGVEFKGYLPVSMFVPIPRRNHVLSLGPILGGNFTAVRGISATRRNGRGFKSTCFHHRVSATYRIFFNISIVIFVVCAHFQHRRIKCSLPIVVHTRSFLLHFLYCDPTVLCLTTLVYPLVVTALLFLVLGSVGFNGYLLVSTFTQPPPP